MNKRSFLALAVAGFIAGVGQIEVQAAVDFDGNGDELLADGSPCLTPGGFGTVFGWARQNNAFASDFVGGYVTKTFSANSMYIASSSSGPSWSAETRDSAGSSGVRSIGGATLGLWEFITAQFFDTTSRMATRSTNTSSSAPQTARVASGMDAVKIGENGQDLLDWEGSIERFGCLSGDWPTPAELSHLAKGADPAVVFSGRLTAYWPLVNNLTASVGGVNFVAGGNATIDSVDVPTIYTPPVFDTAPSLNDATETDIIFNYEAGESGATLFLALYSDGSTPPTTCDEIEIGTGALLTSSEATTGAADTITVGPVGGTQPYDTYFCIERAGDQDSLGAPSVLDVSLDVPLDPGMFSVNPAIIDCDDEDCTFSFTSTYSGHTLYAEALFPGTATPTCDAIETGTGNHGTASLVTNGGAQATLITFTDSPSFRYYDLHFCIEGPGSDSAVVSIEDVEIDPPTGSTWFSWSSIGMGSVLDLFNAEIDPDLVVGDYGLSPALTPGPGTATWTADGNVSIDSMDERHTLANIRFVDISTGNWHPELLSLTFNNEIAVCSPDPTIVLETGVTNASINIAEGTSPYCEDPDGDDVSCALNTGSTLLTGMSLDAANCNITGVPSVEDEDGLTIEVVVTDSLGAPMIFTLRVVSIDEINAPDCTIPPADILANCQDLWSNLFYGAVTFVLDYQYDDMVARNSIMGVVPAAGTPTEPFSTVTITVSRGPESMGTRRITRFPFPTQF